MNQINKINKISFSFYQFGPILAKYKLNDEFINTLLTKGTKSNIDISTKLAGHIDNEKEFSKQDIDWFLNETQEIFLNYIEYLKINSLKNSNVKTVSLKKLWINFMKKGEFNPVHHHTGDISFVIYTEVPNELKIENKNFKGIGSGPGTINFLYGEMSNSYKTEYNMLPTTGDMFIFPASLRHYVPPFKSDCVRSSVSGNFKFEY